MFSAKFEKVKDLKSVIEATRDLIDVANFKLNKNGLSFQAIDTTRTVLVDFQISEKGFLNLKSSEEVTLGIKFQNLYKVFKCIFGDYSLQIRNADVDKFVHMHFENPTETKIARFNLSLMNKVEDDLEIPNSSYDSRVTINSEEFARIIRDLNQIDDDVQIHITKKFFSLSVKSEFIEGSMVYKNTTLAKDEKLVKINVTSEHSGVYSLKFLNEFCRAAILSDVVVLYFSESTPLVVEFELEGKTGSLRYFLASKLI